MRRLASWAVFAWVAVLLGACGDGGGSPASRYAEGPVTMLGPTVPFGLASGYFDGDDRRDLFIPGAIGVEASDLILGARVLLGGPGGTFAPTAPVTVGLPPIWEVNLALVGHLNLDAHQDIVVVSGARYGTLLGRGDGTFDPASAAAGAFPNPIVAVDAVLLDANGDLFDDLAVGMFNGTVAVLLADGAGGFAVSATLAVAPGEMILQLEAADMNGDDHDDLVVLDAASGVTVLLGDGAGGIALGSAIVAGLHGEAKGIQVGYFDDAFGLDLAVMREPLLSPTPPLFVVIVTGDGAGGFGIIDGVAEVPEQTFGPQGRALSAPVVASARGQPGFVVSAEPLAPGPDGRRVPSLYLVTANSAGEPAVEHVPVPQGSLGFLLAVPGDDDFLSDLILLTAGEEEQFCVQVLFGEGR